MQADQPSLPLFSDKATTTVGEVVSVIDLLKEEDAEKIHSTAGVVKMQDFLYCLPAGRLEEVIMTYPPRHRHKARQVLDAARGAAEMRGLMPRSMLTFVDDEQPSGQTDEEQVNDAAVAGPSTSSPAQNSQQV